MELDVWGGDWGIPSVDPASLAVLAYCKFSKAPVEIQSSHSPWRSPNGTFPVLRHNQTVLTNVNQVFSYLREQNYGCEFELSGQESADLYAFMAIVEERLAPAVNHLFWCNAKSFSEVIRPWFGKAVGLPFSIYYPNHYRTQRMTNIHDYYPNLNEDDVETKIYKEARECMNHLSSKLSNSDFFFGTQPTALDALVYGYLAPLLKAPLHHNALTGHLNASENLQAHIRRIQYRYFSKEIEKVTLQQEEKHKETQLDSEEFPNKKRNIVLSVLFTTVAMVGYAFLSGLLQIEIEHSPDDDDDDDDVDQESGSKE